MIYNIPQFDPALMILSFCYSMNSDLSMLLRSRGVFGLMLVRHDLRLITENSSANLNPVQRELLRTLGRSCELNKAKMEGIQLMKCYFQLRTVPSSVCLFTGVRGLGRL